LRTRISTFYRPFTAEILKGNALDFCTFVASRPNHFNVDRFGLEVDTCSWKPPRWEYPGALRTFSRQGGFMKTTSAVVGIVMAAASVAGAQTEKKMVHTMSDMMPMMYTGCVESINHGSAFVLTHLSSDHMMDSHGAAMKNDDMMKTKDEMMKDSAAGGGSMDAMPPAALLLTGAFNMRKHTGQEIRVTGVLSKASDQAMPRELDSLKVSSLKIVAKSCSPEAQHQ
jgi:hypothetical protein